MVILDLTNIVAGAYKGFMNAAGKDVDPTYLAYVLGSTSALFGLSKYIVVRQQNTDPVHKLAPHLSNV
jgi:hypothetical protein